MTQEQYDKMNESWIEYKEDQQDEILTAAQEYEYEDKQPETDLI